MSVNLVCVIKHRLVVCNNNDYMTGTRLFMKVRNTALFSIYCSVTLTKQ
uniref:Uncharacterized protein n=1 Tax=Anguilla anguilla TaxID=7936 RepID=A0A0E9V191_ANGAN